MTARFDSAIFRIRRTSKKVSADIVEIRLPNITTTMSIFVALLLSPFAHIRLVLVRILYGNSGKTIKIEVLRYGSGARTTERAKGSKRSYNKKLNAQIFNCCSPAQRAGECDGPL
jgi:hypothetical protein